MATKQFTITLHVKFHDLHEGLPRYDERLRSFNFEDKPKLIEINGSLLGDLRAPATIELDHWIPTCQIIHFKDLEHYQSHAIHAAIKEALFAILDKGNVAK